MNYSIIYTSFQLFGEMMKLAGDHFDGPDHFKRFIENISNSAYWANFVKLITETLLRVGSKLSPLIFDKDE